MLKVLRVKLYSVPYIYLTSIDLAVGYLCLYG